MLKQKLNSFILEEEWKGIIYYIYESEDANFIESKILEFLKIKNREKKENNTK